MSRGRIEKALSGFYYVNTGGGTLQCRARGKFRREGLSPLVGDWVQIRELGNGEGFVEAVEERRNQFARPAAANIDQLVILASAAIPVTEPYLIDRIASIAALKGCQVLLCLNKCDLDSADALYDIYSRSAIPVLRVSAVTGQGLDALRDAIRGKLSAFTGNSGVGKSSVLNALLPSLDLPVGEVSKALGRGRHTTRHVELFSLGEDTYIIDTPGFSSFDTAEMDLALKQHLPETFPEFAPYVDDCRFTGCTHTKEKGCRVLQAVKDGLIPVSRHRSYVRLFDEPEGREGMAAEKIKAKAEGAPHPGYSFRFWYTKSHPSGWLLCRGATHRKYRNSHRNASCTYSGPDNPISCSEPQPPGELRKLCPPLTSRSCHQDT